MRSRSWHLDRAASTNIALHLHLAVGQFAAVLLAALGSDQAAGSLLGSATSLWTLGLGDQAAGPWPALPCHGPGGLNRSIQKRQISDKCESGHGPWRVLGERSSLTHGSLLSVLFLVLFHL